MSAFGWATIVVDFSFLILTGDFADYESGTPGDYGCHRGLRLARGRRKVPDFSITMGVPPVCEHPAPICNAL